MKPFILEQYLLMKQNQKLVKDQSISDCENINEIIKSLLDQTEYLWSENSVKSNITSNLLNNNKDLFHNEEKLSNID